MVKNVKSDGNRMFHRLADGSRVMAHYDTTYSDLVLSDPISCPVCLKCWRVVEHSNRYGQCVHGGPYVGYIDMND